MAVMRVQFFSDALGLSTAMTVIVPQRSERQIGMSSAAASSEGAPVLYLLHGLSDDDTIWTRRTSIERYAAETGLVVVMPNGARSFYADEVHGYHYWTFLSQELPELVAEFFHVSTRRDDTFVAGLSMGGFGAMKWALRQPERFAAAASLSGALDIDRMVRERPADICGDLDRVYGATAVAGTDEDLLHLLGTADPRALPRLHVCCGVDDYLVDDTRTFVARAQECGIDLTTIFDAGEHEWGYWDARIQDVLAWLPIRGH